MVIEGRLPTIDGRLVPRARYLPRESGGVPLVGEPVVSNRVTSAIFRRSDARRYLRPPSGIARIVRGLQEGPRTSPPYCADRDYLLKSARVSSVAASAAATLLAVA